VKRSSITANTFGLYSPVTFSLLTMLDVID